MRGSFYSRSSNPFRLPWEQLLTLHTLTDTPPHSFIQVWIYSERRAGEGKSTEVKISSSPFSIRIVSCEVDALCVHRSRHIYAVPHPIGPSTTDILLSSVPCNLTNSFLSSRCLFLFLLSLRPSFLRLRVGSITLTPSFFLAVENCHNTGC